MRTALCFVAVVALAVPQSGQAQDSTTPAPTTTTTTTRRPIIRCNYRCSRIYRPVCGRVNGVLTTFANRCVLNGEFRCAWRKWLAGIGVRRQRIRFLYAGRCGRRRRRIVVAAQG